MSAPRRLLPGATYMVSRRCLQRQLLLRPDDLVCEVFRLCLAQAAREHPVEIHAAFVASNHFYIQVTDPDCNLPKFMEWAAGGLLR